MRRATLSGGIAALALGLFAPAASADLFATMLNDFKADGQISACRYSVSDLNAALGLVPSDFEQYAPGFREQVNAALQAHAAGACGGKPAPKQQAAPAPAAPPPAPPARPAPAPKVEVPEPPAPEQPVRQVIETAVKAPPVQPLAVSSGAVRGADAPVPVWLLAALAGAALLAAAGASLAWLLGWSAERFTRPLAAAGADAGGRGADLASEFWDWLRLGR